MARERIHRRLFLSYVALVAVFVIFALWLAPFEGAYVRSVVAGGVLALVLALVFSMLVARSLAPTLVGLTRSVREIAAGQPVRAVDIARDYGVYDEVDDLAGALGELSRQLSEERRALAAEVARQRTILDGMSEGVALLSAGRIAFANPAFGRLLDIHDTVEGMTPLEAVRRFDLAESFANAGTGAVPETRDINGPAGRVLQLRAVPLAAGGAVVVLLDVTEARSLERMRREFVANASHELRTPVAAIHAVAETLAAAPNMSSGDRVRFERILMNHAGRLSRLVKDLLDLSRAEASRPRVEPVDLSKPLASALAAVRERADEKRITLTDQVPAGLPALAADSTSVEQVLVNLLDNAVKYTPEGGRIAIRAQQDERVVRIDVEDTGIGIPAEHLPRIFERFYRVDPARTRDMGGTGLGLAIVKHLLQSHGGDVSVRSRVGGGTTFTVTLPVMQ